LTRRLTRLGPDERRVLAARLAGLDFGRREIAARLGVSERAVWGYLRPGPAHEGNPAGHPNTRIPAVVSASELARLPAGRDTRVTTTTTTDHLRAVNDAATTKTHLGVTEKGAVTFCGARLIVNGDERVRGPGTPIGRSPRAPTCPRLTAAGACGRPDHRPGRAAGSARAARGRDRRRGARGRGAGRRVVVTTADRAGHQPRSRHSPRCGRSVPSVVSLPWPGYTHVASGSGLNRRSVTSVSSSVNGSVTVAE
jgi:hypothetical protein